MCSHVRRDTATAGATHVTLILCCTHPCLCTLVQVHLGLCKTYEDLHPDAGAAGPSDHPQAATAAAAAAGTAAAAGPSDPGGGGAVKRERSASGDGAARDVKRPAAVAPGQHTSR